MATRTPQRQDRTPEEHERDIKHESARFVEIEKAYIDKLFDRLVVPMTRFWRGRATGIDRAAKLVTVSLDPFPSMDGRPPLPQTLACRYGRPNWTAAQIVGKRVRVGYDEEKDLAWIDDVIVGE
jgi:hypothetical protein